MLAHWNVITKWSQRSLRRRKQMKMRDREVRHEGKERQRITSVAGNAIKEWGVCTKWWVSGSKKRGGFSVRSPVNCVIWGMQGEGSGGRMKALRLLPSHLFQHTWSSKGKAQWEWLAEGPCWGVLPKPRSACLPTPLYFWKHPLCKHFPFKISGLMSV